VDNKLSINMRYLAFEVDNQVCPVAQHFGVRVVSNFNRVTKGIENRHCPQTKKSCCSESGFITMADNWSLDSIPRGATWHNTAILMRLFTKGIGLEKFFKMKPSKADACQMDNGMKKKCNDAYKAFE